MQNILTGFGLTAGGKTAWDKFRAEWMGVKPADEKGESGRNVPRGERGERGIKAHQNTERPRDGHEGSMDWGREIVTTQADPHQRRPDSAPSLRSTHASPGSNSYLPTPHFPVSCSDSASAEDRRHTWDSPRGRGAGEGEPPVPRREDCSPISPRPGYGSYGGGGGERDEGLVSASPW